MTTDAAQLAAKGAPITLADGTTVHLRYTFRSIAALEDRFGSLIAANTALREAYAGLRDPHGSGPVFGVLRDCIAPGLLHVEDRPLGTDLVILGDLLDPGRFRAYNAAWTDAMREAFGQLYDRAVEGVDPQQAQETETAASPGSTGTTSPPSPQAAQTTRSGA